MKTLLKVIVIAAALLIFPVGSSFAHGNYGYHPAGHICSSYGYGYYPSYNYGYPYYQSYSYYPYAVSPYYGYNYHRPYYGYNYHRPYSGYYGGHSGYYGGHSGYYGGNRGYYGGQHSRHYPSVQKQRNYYGNGRTIVRRH